jgi:hypothetical protein
MEKERKLLTEEAIEKGRSRFSKRRENRPSKEEGLKIVRKNKTEIKSPFKKKIAQPPEVDI